MSNSTNQAQPASNQSATKNEPTSKPRKTLLSSLRTYKRNLLHVVQKTLSFVVESSQVHHTTAPINHRQGLPPVIVGKRNKCKGAWQFWQKRRHDRNAGHLPDYVKPCCTCRGYGNTRKKDKTQATKGKKEKKKSHIVRIPVNANKGKNRGVLLATPATMVATPAVLPLAVASGKMTMA